MVPMPPEDEEIQEEPETVEQPAAVKTATKPNPLPPHLVKLLQEGLDARDNEKPKCQY